MISFLAFQLSIPFASGCLSPEFINARMALTFQNSPMNPVFSPPCQDDPPELIPYEQKVLLTTRNKLKYLHDGERLTEEFFIPQHQSEEALRAHIIGYASHETACIASHLDRLAWLKQALTNLFDQKDAYANHSLLYWAETNLVLAKIYMSRWEVVNIMTSKQANMDYFKNILDNHKLFKSYIMGPEKDWRQVHGMEAQEECFPYVTILDNFNIYHGPLVEQILTEAVPGSLHGKIDAGGIFKKLIENALSGGGSESQQVFNCPPDRLNLRMTRRHLNFFKFALKPAAEFAMYRGRAGFRVSAQTEGLFQDFGPIVNISVSPREDCWTDRQDLVLHQKYSIVPIVFLYICVQLIRANKVIVQAAGNESLQINSSQTSHTRIRALCELGWARMHLVVVGNLRSDGLRPHFSSTQPGANPLINTRFIMVIGCDEHANLGSSISAPRVSGAIAMLLTKAPHLSPPVVAQIILDTASPIVLIREHPGRLWGKPIVLNCLAKDFVPGKSFQYTGNSGKVKSIYITESMWGESRSKYGTGILNFSAAEEFLKLYLLKG